MLDELVAIFDTVQARCDIENADILIHGDMVVTCMECEYTHMNDTLLTSIPPAT